MLEYLLVVIVAWTLVLCVELRALGHRLKRLEAVKQAGAPRPTTTPASPVGRWGVDLSEPGVLRVRGNTSPGSPASPLPPTTLALLQALGEWGSSVLSHVELCSKCQGLGVGHMSLFKMLARRAVDLAWTSARQATKESVEQAQAPATSGSKLSSYEESERIKTYPARELTDPVLTDGDYGRMTDDIFWTPAH